MQTTRAVASWSASVGSVRPTACDSSDEGLSQWRRSSTNGHHTHGDSGGNCPRPLHRARTCRCRHGAGVDSSLTSEPVRRALLQALQCGHCREEPLRSAELQSQRRSPQTFPQSRFASFSPTSLWAGYRLRESLSPGVALVFTIRKADRQFPGSGDQFRLCMQRDLRRDPFLCGAVE
jgi:hypothetical protein